VPVKKMVRAHPRKNLIARFTDSIRKYLRETVGELRKVSWPTRQEAMNLTKIVLIVIGVVAFYFFIVDGALTLLFEVLLGIS
jgi:preprotein translocase subunit SecE